MSVESLDCNARFNKLMARARRTNRDRDRCDRDHGMAAPSDCPPYEQVATVLSALQAGINTEDWNCVAEAYDMLEQYRNTLPRTMA